MDCLHSSATSCGQRRALFPFFPELSINARTSFPEEIYRLFHRYTVTYPGGFADRPLFSQTSRVACSSARRVLGTPKTAKTYILRNLAISQAGEEETWVWRLVSGPLCSLLTKVSLPSANIRSKRSCSNSNIRFVVVFSSCQQESDIFPRRTYSEPSIRNLVFC